ncbi:MAG: hypothetical protein ABR607_11385 [Pyrinomonadaceae bacterium]
MKRIIKILALAATVAVFAIPALAQKQECTDENKGAWYGTFYNNYKGDAPQQKVAYDAAKMYLDTCPADPNDKQAAFMKKFVDLVDESHKKASTGKDFEKAVADKKYAEQMRLGKELLATDADNVDINSILGIAGLADASLLNDSAQYARKAIQLIESGKSLKTYQKDQALAYLNWTIGKSQITSSPADAISSLLKAANVNSDVKKSPQLYLDLNAAYENGPRAKLSEQYKSVVGPNGTETEQSKVVLENLNQVIDRQIDALARATALASNANDKKAAMDELAALYKYRNKGASDANVTELVASVLTRPIPEPPTPISALPATTPGGTPATNNGGSAATNGGGMVQPEGNSLTNSSTNGRSKIGAGTQTGNAKPASSPTPLKKPPVKYRRN